MRVVQYTQVITEREAELLHVEQQLRGQRTAARVQALRLLKSGQAATVRAVAPMVGYTERQVQEWWRRYRVGGLAALLVVPARRGTPSKLTDVAYRGLEAEMTAGRIATLRDTQAYLRVAWGIEYRSLNGVWLQLRKRRAKPKTGRRRHRKADGAAQAAFQQTSVSR